jgi:hypothetical protein
MNFFGYQMSLAVISGVVSVLLSLAGFVIGMRVAKERADRTLLRKLYQDLYAHFREIKDAAEHGRPREWTDYRKDDLFLPLVRSLERDGSLNLLPPRLSKRFLEVETSALKTSHAFRKVVSDDLTPLVKGIVEQHVTKPSEVISGKPYRSYSIGMMALKPKFDADISQRPDGTDLGVGIELAMERGHSHSLHLYREKMKSGQLLDVLHEIEQAISANVPTQRSANELRQVTKEIGVVLELISSRIKDPHPLIETITQAVPDVFRR